MTETDIRTKFITPAILARWDVITQMLEERFHEGQSDRSREDDLPRGSAVFEPLDSRTIEDAAPAAAFGKRSVAPVYEL